MWYHGILDLNCKAGNTWFVSLKIGKQLCFCVMRHPSFIFFVSKVFVIYFHCSSSPIYISGKSYNGNQFYSHTSKNFWQSVVFKGTVINTAVVEFFPITWESSAGNRLWALTICFWTPLHSRVWESLGDTVICSMCMDGLSHYHPMRCRGALETHTDWKQASSESNSDHQGEACHWNPCRTYS